MDQCQESINEVFRFINSVVGVISGIFLIITLLCYLIIPDLRNCQGKIIVQASYNTYVIGFNEILLFLEYHQ